MEGWAFLYDRLITQTGSQIMTKTVDNIHVSNIQPLPSPIEIKDRLPVSNTIETSVNQARDTIKDILSGKDKRLLVVAGPCSIHDTAAALDYAKKLKALSDELADELYIVMRVYFEKPRTTTGWKGMINDPYIDDSFRIEDGITVARDLLMQLCEMGLPCGTEALDPISVQYYSDLISWYAIGARTTESQTHREMASGLSAPVGFKNGTDGSLDVAINAMLSVSHPHRFLGINKDGHVSIISTTGNPYGHVVLRGGGGKPNYDSVSIREAEEALEAKNLAKNLIVDCSHANSSKQHERQVEVLRDIINQKMSGNTSIVGVMLESHLVAGNQKIPEDLGDLVYGQSITDACIDWDTTEKALKEAAERLATLD